LSKRPSWWAIEANTGALGADEGGVDEVLRAALAGDEHHQGRCAAGVLALDDLHQLLELLRHPGGVGDQAHQPEDHLVEVQDDAVVAQAGGVAGQLVPAVGGRHPARGGGGPRRQPGGGEAGEQAPAHGGIEAGAGLVVPRGVPGGRGGGGAEERRRGGGEALVELGEEGGVAHLGAELLAVVEHGGVGEQQGQVGLGVQRPRARDVGAEHLGLEALRPEHVDGHLQQPLVADEGVPLAQGVQRREPPRGGVAGEHQIEHGHEVRLARAERSVEVHGSAGAAGQRLADEAERAVEAPDQLGRDGVGVDRALGVGEAGGERLDVVALADAGGEVEQVADERHRGNPGPGGRGSAQQGVRRDGVR
jgi:hypothetical protein